MSKIDNRLDAQVNAIANNKYTGLLWIDDNDNSTNFRFNIAGGDFSSAREILIRFIAVLQEKLDNAERCPYFEHTIKSMIRQITGIIYPPSSIYPHGVWIVEDCPYCHLSHAHARSPNESNQIRTQAKCGKGEYIISF
jgi:hypothetical protein